MRQKLRASQFFRQGSLDRKQLRICPTLAGWVQAEFESSRSAPERALLTATPYELRTQDRLSRLCRVWAFDPLGFVAPLLTGPSFSFSGHHLNVGSSGTSWLILFTLKCSPRLIHTFSFSHLQFTCCLVRSQVYIIGLTHNKKLKLIDWLFCPVSGTLQNMVYVVFHFILIAVLQGGLYF